MLRGRSLDASALLGPSMVLSPSSDPAERHSIGGVRFDLYVTGRNVAVSAGASVTVGAEALKRTLDLGLCLVTTDPVGGLHEFARFQILVVHKEVLDRLEFIRRHIA